MKHFRELSHLAWPSDFPNAVLAFAACPAAAVDPGWLSWGHLCVAGPIVLRTRLPTWCRLFGRDPYELSVLHVFRIFTPSTRYNECPFHIQEAAGQRLESGLSEVVAGAGSERAECSS